MDLLPSVVVGEPASDVLFGLFLARRSGPDAPAWLDRADRARGPCSAAARALDVLTAELSADNGVCRPPPPGGSVPREVRELAYLSLLEQARSALCLVGAAPSWEGQRGSG